MSYNVTHMTSSATLFGILFGALSISIFVPEKKSPKTVTINTKLIYVLVT